MVNVDPKVVLAREGEAVDIMCRAGRPIDYCRFLIPNEHTKVMTAVESIPGFAMIGEGFQAGQCGIRIANVLAKHNGPVNCTLGLGASEVTGTAMLTVGKAPERPILQILTPPGPQGAYEVNSDFRAECISMNGRPAANLSWLLDGEPIVNGLSQPQMVENNNEFSVSQQFERQIQTADDQLELTCRSEHFAIPNGYLEVKTKFVVRCKWDRQKISSIAEKIKIVFCLLMVHLQMAHNDCRFSTPKD